MSKHDIPTPTSFDTGSALETVWAALHGFREDCIPEGDPTYDDQWGDICTAMAWISEALGRDEVEDGAQVEPGQVFHPQFPDFPMADFPTIWPEGFRDTSWRGDLSPSLTNDAGNLRIWINYANPDQRHEFKARYQAYWFDDGEGDTWTIYEGDDWQALLGAIADERRC